MIQHSTLLISEVVPGFCVLQKRSATLEGSLPLRASQYCVPVMSGSAAGFQIKMLESTWISWGTESLRVASNKTTNDIIAKRLPEGVDRLVRHGMLPKHGYWHRLFETSGVVVEDDRLLIWTGYVVSGGTTDLGLVTGAFNRGPGLEVIPHLVADQRMSPLVVEVEIGPSGEVWLEREVACVLPMPAAGRVWRSEPFQEHTELADLVGKFYDEEYFAQKCQSATGRYRKLVKKSEHRSPVVSDPTLVTMGPPQSHTFGFLNRAVTPDGWCELDEGDGLHTVDLRTTGPLRATWNGARLLNYEPVSDPVSFAALRRDWESACGDRCPTFLNTLSSPFGTLKYGEPYVFLLPWVLVITPPDWVTVMDGYSRGIVRGMRGIVDTDMFHAVNTAYHLIGPGEIDVDPGGALLRLFALPREYLARELKQIPFEELPVPTS